jgi:hypothetical protein
MPIYRPVFVAAVPENVPQETGLRMKTVLITQPCLPVWKVRHACWMRARVQVEIRVGRLTVHFIAQGVQRGPHRKHLCQQFFYC